MSTIDPKKIDQLHQELVESTIKSMKENGEIKTTKVAGSLNSAENDISEWGYLPMEPCRFCRQQNCVYFNIDEGPEGKVGLQTQRCEKCKRTWTADSSNA